MNSQNLLKSYLHIITLIGLETAIVHAPGPAQFSVSSLMESALPAIHPIVAAGSDRCEYFKSFFGLTYDQLQKNAGNTFFDSLNIDHITRTGPVKYNLTSTRRLTSLARDAKKIVVLIHGFMETSDGIMVKALAPVFLKDSEYQVLALDGRKILSYEYFRSSTYARFMGESLGTLLSEIIKNGLDPKQIILVGHSLGAHTAGIAGKRVQQLTGKQLGRIAALDPAGPCFSNVSLAGKLDRTDAEYVDVIHTNAGVFGTSELVGHKDFYPNGGMMQPGCYFYTCDHSRAWELFAESVASPKHFPARRCFNWTTFRDGLCSKNEVAYLGINSRAGNEGIYFLSTGSTSPFGLGPAGSGLGLEFRGQRGGGGSGAGAAGSYAYRAAPAPLFSRPGPFDDTHKILPLPLHCRRRPAARGIRDRGLISTVLLA